MRQFVLPAADEAESIWTSKFGFAKLDQEEVRIFLFLSSLSCICS